MDLKPKSRTQGRYLDFISNVPVPKEDRKFFSASLPVCAAHYFRDNTLPHSYKPIPFLSRYKKEDTADLFFNTTINSSNTVPHLFALVRKDVLVPNHEFFTKASLRWHEKAFETTNYPHLVVLCHLSSGINGFQNTAHGGVLASLVDETMSICAELFRESAGLTGMNLYTANLNMSYKAPVVTPGVVVIKASLIRRIGPKWFLLALILDCDGKVLVDADALWIEARKVACL